MSESGPSRSPLNVLMLTRKVDRNDRKYSGFTHDWITALASRVEHLEVICKEVGDTDLPPNVRLTHIPPSMTSSRWKMLVPYQRMLWPRIKDADVVFAHPSPQFALAAVPGARAYGVPVVLWYTSGVVKPVLKMAHALVDRIVTASPESYPLPGNHITVTGHGIDLSYFTPPASVNGGDERLVLGVGRLTPDKDFSTQIEAAARVVQSPGFDDVRFAVVGEEPDWALGERARLEKLIADLKLEERFQLLGGMPYSRMVELYQSSTVLVSTSRVGAVDKVPLEAIGCGLPVIVTEPAYAPVLDADQSFLLAREGDPEDVAEKLSLVLSMPAEERDELTRRLRRQVEEQHDLGVLMDRIVAVFCEEVDRRGLRKR